MAKPIRRGERLTVTENKYDEAIRLAAKWDRSGEWAIARFDEGGMPRLFQVHFSEKVSGA